ncbi:MAG: hypothetical protein MUC54_00845 [Chloroflexi bacterium]|jgi:hypothetical protein|nr:hypothetical protein [Chloroflexota bacterium]
MTPDDIDSRLAALEATAPVDAGPPALAHAGRRGLLLTPAAPAGLLALAMVGSAAAGGALVAGLAQGFPGVQNPGEALEGAGMECMSPPEAAAFLAAKGYTDVVWQVESGVAGEKSGRSVQQATAPAHGYVVPGAILSDGRLYMIVDQRVGAAGGGACPDLPTP